MQVDGKEKNGRAKEEKHQKGAGFGHKTGGTKKCTRGQTDEA